MIMRITPRDAIYTRMESTGTDRMAGKVPVFIFRILSIILKKSCTRYMPSPQFARVVIYLLFVYFSNLGLLLIMSFTKTNIKNADSMVLGPVLSKN